MLLPLRLILKYVLLSLVTWFANINLKHSLTLLDGDDLTSEEQEEKARLIAQVLELQNTLDDLSSRVDNVKEENLRLRSENQVLGQYIENLMAASSVFQPANGEPAGGRGAGQAAGGGAGGGGYGKKK